MAKNNNTNMRQTIRTILVVILLVIAVALFVAKDALLFLIGTAKGLLVLNFLVYLAVFIASFTVSYIMRRAYGPFLKRISKKIFGSK